MGPVRAATVTSAVMIAAVAGAAPAVSTPARGINAAVLSQSTSAGQDFVTRLLIIEPGGSTGWHWHPGRVFGIVKQGTLTHNRADCSLDGVYRAGDPITEDVGADHVHIGRNLGDTPVVMQVLYINPAGSPLAVDAADPGCGYD